MPNPHWQAGISTKEQSASARFRSKARGRVRRFAAMYLDAHNHLHDARLADWRAAQLTGLPTSGICRAVVNGTRESDWPAVAMLAASVPWVVPSFGLHPWHVNERSADWLTTLAAQLDAHPGCGVGEVGLDRWIAGHDIAVQTECLAAQIALATARNAPLTLHCIRAWGALWEIVRTSPLPQRGFLLHAYGGPSEMVAGFLARGAFFSFSPYFLHERKAEQRAIFAALPAARILVETDAPDLAPPPEQNPRPLSAPDGSAINDPTNLLLAYRALATLRGVSVEELAGTVAGTFERLFLAR